MRVIISESWLPLRRRASDSSKDPAASNVAAIGDAVAFDCTSEEAGTGASATRCGGELPGDISSCDAAEAENEALCFKATGAGRSFLAGF